MVLLVTAAELASHLKKDLDTASAEQAIATASGYVEDKTGYAFTTRTATLTLPSSPALTLQLPVRPVRAVTAVTIGGSSYTDFRLTATGEVYRGRSWRTAYEPQDVEVTITYGIAVVPSSIKGVVLEVAGGIYDGQIGVESEQIDDYRVAYSGVLSHTSLATLAAYGADVASLSMTGR
jgi:hypothetical protein